MVLFFGFVLFSVGSPVGNFSADALVQVYLIKGAALSKKIYYCYVLTKRLENSSQCNEINAFPNP